MAAKRVLAACFIATLAVVAPARAQLNVSPFSYMLDAGMLQAAPPMPTASASTDTNTRGAGDVKFGPRQAVPQMPCRPGDSPETDLQGRVPPTDIQTGRAALG